MVLLWTQHDGERIEPQPTDEIVQEHRKEDKENLHHLANKQNLKGDVSTSKGESSTSPVPTIRVDDMSGVTSPSEKHVVTLRQVSEIMDRKKSSAYIASSVSPSTSSPFSASPSPPPSSCATTITDTIEEEVSVETIETAPLESASRVAVNKTATLGAVVQLEEEEEEGEGKKKKSNKRKFYTLPRNWKSKAADFILTKGRVNLTVPGGGKMVHASLNIV
ncbi:uncharacterized protein LOC121864693 [Homarus americanus]|uniref:uncharacterized protein LOC121864693 n=1 Tax=Homarus americanus TaxID=6706 RepID=UPI001C489F4F|nr:uncharacterized protein LOC121864693 [Homarus americanus]